MSKDILLGVLASQLGFVAAADVAAAAAGQAGAGRDLGQLLVAAGKLTPERLARLLDLADEMMAVHGGNVDRSIAALGGNRAVRATFGAVAAADDGFHSTVVASADLDFDQPLDLSGVTEEAQGRYAFEGGRERCEIGRGGIGRVMMAYDQHLGRTVAVKELLDPELEERTSRGSTQWDPKRGSMTRATVARFLREARVTGQLEHPSIVPVYEVGRRTDGTLYYTMKLVRGRTFEEAVTACPGLRDRLKLLPHYLNLCNAIAYAHSRKVLHRDIKPRNVMLGEFGETVVLDWGLAKVKGAQDLRGDELEQGIKLFRDAAAGKTVDGTAVGTPAYMSPEQAAGKLDEVDEQSDVWSLGAVLYELLTGRPPFDGTHAFEVMDKVLEQPVVPARVVLPEVPKDLSAVAQRALTKDRASRYARAADLAADVSAYMEGRRVSAYEYGAWELVKRLVLQHKAVSGLLLGLALLLLVSTVVVSIAYREADVNRLKAEAQTRQAELSRVSEEAARIDAEKNERSAHLNLAIAYGEEASRLLAGRNYLGAGVFAAAALEHNPYNPLSEYRFPDTEARGGAGAGDLAMMHSCLYAAHVNQRVRLDASVRGHDAAVYGLDFGRDGTQMVSVGVDGGVKLWSVPGRSVSAELGRHTGTAMAAAFSPDGRWIASGGEDNEVRLYLASERKGAGVVLRHGQRVRGLAFASDSGRLFTAGNEGKIFEWSVPGGQLLASMAGHQGPIWSIAATRDGRLLVSAGEDKTVRLWDVARHEQTAVLSGHTGMVFTVAVSPAGDLAASAGYDGTVRLWRLPDGEALQELRGHEGHVISVSFLFDGSMLASGGHDRRVCLWQVPGGELLTNFIAHDSYVRAVRFSPDGKLLATGAEDGVVRLWSLPSPLRRDLATGHDDSVFQTAYSPDGTLLATSSFDKTIRLFPMAGGSPVVLKGHERFGWSLAFSPDGTLLASGGADSLIKLWSIPMRMEVATFTGHPTVVGTVAFAPGGATLVSGGEDGIRLWSVADKTEVGRYRTSSGVWSGAFSPGGKVYVTGLSSGGLQVFDAGSMVSLRELPAHRDRVSGLAFSPDGGTLVSSGKDGRILVWSTATWQQTKELAGHTQWVNSVRFSPDGKLLISGSDDNTARVWDVVSGRVLHIQPASKEVTAVGFTRSGDRFSVAEGTTVHLFPAQFDSWAADPAGLRTRAQSEAGMDLSGFTLRSPR
jgi:WD40 repeat protein/serine/threonine protein kinase